MNSRKRKLQKLYKLFFGQLMILAILGVYALCQQYSPAMHLPDGLSGINDALSVLGGGMLFGLVKFKNQVLDVAAVAASTTAVVYAPTGDRYLGVVLVTGDSAAGNTTAPTISAIINEIRVNLDGEIIRKFTPSQLDIINTAMGATFASQAYTGAANGGGRRHIPIYFAEPWRKRLRDQDALALQTGYLGRKGKFQIEVDLKGSITPVLTAFAVTDKVDSGKANAIMKWLPTDIQASATPIQITNFDRSGLWSQISYFDSSDAKTVDRVRMTADSVEIHDLAKDENTTILKDIDMNPAAGAYHVVFDQDDALEDCYPAASAKAISATLTMSAAPSGTLRYIIQRLGLPGSEN